jgi:transcriptional regulator with XRE-family HTH domain
MPRKSSATNTAKRSGYNVRQAVGSNIKIRRLELGWSQQELADRFGVSRAAISQYEIGTGEVNAGDLPRLADILGLSLLEFYEGPLFDLCDTQSENRNWPVKMATLLLEKSGLLNRSQQQDRSQQQADKRNADGSEQRVPEDIDNISKDHIFISDEFLGGAWTVPYNGEPKHDFDSVIRLADLAGNFLALSRQDQETLSRVAEALRDKPAVKDEPAVASKSLPTKVSE